MIPNEGAQAGTVRRQHGCFRRWLEEGATDELVSQSTYFRVAMV